MAGVELEAVRKTFGGQRVNELHPRQRNIVMVFQNYALYAHMTVYDNMAFALRLKRTCSMLPPVPALPGSPAGA